MFGLAANGKTNKKAMPNPLRLAMITRAYSDAARLRFPSAALQQPGIAAAWAR
jgi:hypothetical protein